MQLSKDIKAGLLQKKYHVVLDEAYPCTVQEMSPWNGRNLVVEKDAFNYYSLLNHQVIEFMSWARLQVRFGVLLTWRNLDKYHQGRWSMV
jgi:hypothetical protein